MGPTIPDQCQYLPPGALPKDAAAVCMGADYGSTLRDANGNQLPPRFPSPCFSPTARVGCPDPDACVGMICRTLEGTKLKRATDGLSSTFLVGETLPAHSRYACTFCENFNIATTHIPLNTMEDELGNPPSNHYRASGFKSSHPSGVHFAMSDGSVQFVSEAIDYYVINALGTKAAGETANLGSQ
jgi:hypothetical protein